MRNTKQREVILNIINNSSNHLNANSVYLEAKKVISNISLGTIYRNLNNLVDENKIIRLKMSDGVDRFDKNIIHAHVVCSSCGRIDDVMYDYIKKLPNIKDYEVMSYDLRFNGKCKECLEKEKRKNGIKRK